MAGETKPTSPSSKKSSAPNPLLEIGPIPDVPGYEITGELGRGGMGVVFSAKQVETGQDVALKLLPTNAEDMLKKRFDLEIEIAKMLDHPDIVTVFDTGFSDDYAWIAMEVLDGFELRDAMPDRRFTLEERISVLSRVALALQHAHEQNVTHRDVKPSNIFLTWDGGVRLLDFGVAKIRDKRLTKTGKTVGTPQYMAPEQIMAQGVDARTDIFALASVTYEVLSGQPPWNADHDHQLMMAICTKPPTPFSESFRNLGWFELPEPSLKKLHATLHKGLSAEPTRRQQSMKEFAEALDNLLTGPATDEHQAPISQQRWSEQRIDWARAKAARARAQSLPPSLEAPSLSEGTVPPPSGAFDDEDDGDSSVMVWVALVALFVLGIGVALYFLM